VNESLYEINNDNGTSFYMGVKHGLWQ
jgi:hypothetical protein